MKIYLDRTYEGTPEELAAFQATKKRWADDKAALPAVPVVFPFSFPPAKPTIGEPSRVCNTCAAKRARGENAICGCVLGGPRITN